MSFVHDINSQRIHPSYDSGQSSSTLSQALERYRNDVALYRLRYAATGVDRLTLARNAPPANKNCTVVGFGRSSESNNYSILRKKRATMRIADFREDHFSATRNTGETTQGDSGGPIICDQQVRGITSFSAAPASDPRADTDWFKRAYYLRTWINDVADDWNVAGVD